MHPGEVEHESIQNMQKRLGRPCGPKNARLAREFSESDDNTFELLEDSVALMEFADSAVTFNCLSIQELQLIGASPLTKEHFLTGLGKLFVLDTILLNNDRLPSPVFPEGRSHFNFSNLMVRPKSGETVGIDCEVNGVHISEEEMDDCQRRVQLLARSFLSSKSRELNHVNRVNQTFSPEAIYESLLGSKIFDAFKIDATASANILLERSIRDGFRCAQEAWISGRFQQVLDRCAADSFEIIDQLKGYKVGSNFAMDVAYYIESVNGRGAAVAMCDDADA